MAENPSGVLGNPIAIAPLTKDCSSTGDCSTQILTDKKIFCTNSRNLDAILKTAMQHVEVFAEEQKLGDRKSEFLSHFKEIMTNTIQDNVSVQGLPYQAREFSVASTQQEQDFLSDICNELHKTVGMRKKTPQQCIKSYKMKTDLEMEHLKNLPISHSEHIPSVSDAPKLTSSLVPVEVSKKVITKWTSTVKQVKQKIEKLQDVEENAISVETILENERRLEMSLCDTGYDSS